MIWISYLKILHCLRYHQCNIDSKIRTEEQLKEAFEFVMNKYSKGEGDYNYLDSQLRMIRQEATVRQVQDEFAIKLYETHAL